MFACARAAPLPLVPAPFGRGLRGDFAGAGDPAGSRPRRLHDVVSSALATARDTNQNGRILRLRFPLHLPPSGGSVPAPPAPCTGFGRGLRGDFAGQVFMLTISLAPAETAPCAACPWDMPALPAPPGSPEGGPVAQAQVSKACPERSRRAEGPPDGWACPLRCATGCFARSLLAAPHDSSERPLPCVGAGGLRRATARVAWVAWRNSSTAMRSTSSTVIAERILAATWLINCRC